MSRTGNTGNSGVGAAAGLGERSEVRVGSAMDRLLMDELPPQKDANAVPGAEIHTIKGEKL